MNGNEWNLVEILMWIKVSGSAILTTALISWLAEYWLWWQKQSVQFKLTMSVVICVVIALAAHLVLTFVPAEVLAEIQPYFAVIMTAIANIVGTQVFHKLSKKDPVPPPPALPAVRTTADG